MKTKTIKPSETDENVDVPDGEAVASAEPTAEQTAPVSVIPVPAESETEVSGHDASMSNVDSTEEAGVVYGERESQADGQTMPTMGDVLRIAALDKRVGHYILDLLSGIPAADAFKSHFPVAPTEAEMERIISDAEQRGYLRGRNEQVELEMRDPASRIVDNETALSDCTDDFLTSSRRDAWSL